MQPLNIKGRLIGKVIVDWCNNLSKENSEVFFKESMCSGLTSIRFVTRTLNGVFTNNETENGYALCYEILNQNDDVSLSVKLDRQCAGKSKAKICSQLAKSAGIQDNDDNVQRLAFWSVTDEAKDESQISIVLDQLFEYEITYFEEQLKQWLEDNNKSIMAFPQYNQQLLLPNEMPDEIFIEGSMRDILTNKYERNIKARSRCIAHYGAVCQICGMDFSAVYGDEFKGRIEVHHRKPLYEIRENYIVDPIKDLVPVCPNCHMVLHSKPDGVYTVEEIKTKLNHK